MQVGDRAEEAAAEAVPGHFGEELLDGVEPGGRGGVKWKVQARMTRQPGQHFGMLVGGIDVDMDRPIGRDLALDSIEESERS